MSPAFVLAGRPGVFLAWFAGITALLLPGWNWVSEPYAQGLVWLLNAGLHMVLPHSLHLTASVTHGALGSAFVAAIALFLATPHRNLVWKIRWSTTVILALVSVHAALLTAQVHQAHASLEAMHETPRRFVSGEALVSGAGVDLASAWYWLFPLLTALVWFIAIQRPQEES